MPSTLRVALLATVVEFGGIERVLLNLLEHIGPRVQLFPILFTRNETRANYFLKRVQSLEIPYETILVNACKYKYWNPINNIGEAISCCKRKQFDLIHTHGYRADLIGLFVSKYFNVPIISTCHGYISTDKKLDFYNKLDLFLLKYFNRIIAVSESMKQGLIATGLDEKKIQVITNAVWDGNRTNIAEIRKQTRSNLGIRNEEFVFGFVGRLSEEKGVDYLLEATKQGLAEANLWRLVLVGDGPRRLQLEQIVQNAGFMNKVHFAGFQSDTVPWYSVMDAFVLSSLTEGSPMALLEAMANGIPAIATSVGGVPAIISNRENGILVSPADIQGLLEAMHFVAENHDFRSRLSNAAIQTIQRDYDVKNWVKKIGDIYMETVQYSQRFLRK